MSNNIQSEIDLIYQMIIHPAGFEIGNSGILQIRKYDRPQGVKLVEWAVEEEIDGKSFDVHEFSDPMKAATFFVKRRHEMELGLDFEKEII